MPPKRTRSGAAAAPPKEKKARQSKLAKQNDISGEEEAEIKEAFHLFYIEDEDYEDEKEGVIPTKDVRKALIALGLPPKDTAELNSIISALDPTSSNIVTYEPFLSLCAMKLHARTSESISEEIESAYRLFTRGGDGPINISHLRRVARDLKEDVGDDMLRNMIRTGNGGDSVQNGVTLDQFRDIMTRAGVF